MAMLTNYGNSNVFANPIILSEQKYTFGRALNNSYIFDEISVSRNHCNIEFKNNKWILIDKSANGTFVNGFLLGMAKEHILQHGDVISIGDHIKFSFINTSEQNANNTQNIKNSELLEEEILSIADAILAEAEGSGSQVQNKGSVPQSELSFSNITQQSQNVQHLPHVTQTNPQMIHQSIFQYYSPQLHQMSQNPSHYHPNMPHVSYYNNYKLSNTSQPLQFHLNPHEPHSSALYSTLTGPASHPSFNNSNYVEPRRSESSNNESKSPKVKPLNKSASKKKPGKNSVKKEDKEGTSSSQIEKKDTFNDAKVKSEPDPQPSCSKTSVDKINAAEDELQCSICTEMFVKAATLSCSHTFCKFCIDEWKKKKTVCPICRAPIKSVFPTLVIDNYIAKIIEDADEETKQHRAKLIAERETKKEPETKKPPKKQKLTSDTSNFPAAPIVLSSDSDTELSDFGDSEMDSYDDYYGYVPYNGNPGAYFGGYGFCYNCGDPGHWARGCPNR